VVSIGVGLVNVPVYFRKRQIIEHARSERNKLSTTVVGITGSVGKTSTKFFLHQLLEQIGKNVRSTKQHRNSEFTVSQDILEQLNEEVDVYVAEMGAYRKSEIKLLSQLTQPSLGVITTIGNQHLALFGSQENLLNAKWELIEALPKSGTAVLNADDKLLQKKAEHFNGKVIWYSITKPADVYMSEVVLEPTQTKATLHIQDQTCAISLPLVSEGLLVSFTAAVAAACALGVEGSVIAKAVSTLKPFTRTMEIRSGINSSTVIDDSYSASEDAVRNAVAHLTRFSQSDKRVIMVPVIELGTEGSTVHARLSKVLAESGARVFVYGDSFKEELSSQLSVDRIQWFDDAKELATVAAKDVSDDTVMVLEGRIPSVVRKSVLA
ncbi:MAG: UDP-N-acetylmuramoyl-tripeptide--D-alanyl-D-alanine ligase, partial [Candidatus Andersenbacteria bacterium]